MAPTQTAPHVQTLVFVDSSQEQRNFICPVCKKTFKRSEHCARHQRAHTKERPFPCKFCNRRYARRDLVLRHERTLHGQQSSASERERGVPGPKSTENKLSGSDENSTTSNTNLPRSAEAPLLETTALKPGTTSPMRQSAPQAPGVIHELAEASEAPQRISESVYPEPGDCVFGSLGDNTLRDFDILMNSSMDEPTSLDLFEELSFFDPFYGLSSPIYSSLDMNMHANMHTAENASCRQSQQGGMPAKSRVVGQRRLSQPPNLPDPLIFPLPPTDDPSSVTSSESSIGDTCSPSDRDIPGIIKTPHQRFRLVQLTEEQRSKILQDLKSPSHSEDQIKHDLPSATAFNKLLQTFVDVFLPHLPIIHFPTLELDKTPSPLVLAMCAIGGLYRLERKVSLRLYLHADRLLMNEWRKLSRPEACESVLSSYKSRCSRDAPSSNGHLWMFQCKLLLTWFATFTGNPTLVKQGMENVGTLVDEYRSRMHHLSSRRPCHPTNWCEWGGHESAKRLLHAIFILCSLLTAAYDVPPMLSVLQDGEVELPCDDKAWEASTDTAWQQCISQTKDARKFSVLDGVSHLMNSTPSQADADGFSWSPFAATVILHGVSIHFWYLSRYTELAHVSGLSLSATQSPESLHHTHNNTILARCHAHISQARESHDDLWDEKEGPLLFSCLCLLRSISLSAFAGVNSIDKRILLASEPSEVTMALQKFMSTSQARNVFVTKTASQALEGIKAPSKAGWKLVQKTAGLTWSVDVAIFYWSFGLFFVKWLHTIEKLRRHDTPVDASETVILDDTRHTFVENDLMDSDSKSVAAQISRHLANNLDDTWSWAITARFGYIFRELATMCELDC